MNKVHLDFFNELIEADLNHPDFVVSNVTRKALNDLYISNLAEVYLIARNRSRNSLIIDKRALKEIKEWAKTSVPFELYLPVALDVYMHLIKDPYFDIVQIDTHYFKNKIMVEEIKYALAYRAKKRIDKLDSKDIHFNEIVNKIIIECKRENDYVAKCANPNIDKDKHKNKVDEIFGFKENTIEIQNAMGSLGEINE